tara:strand:- start:16 stop:222 length:207 start_codon:yes stop_codon:yes gene_type:complete
MILLWGFHNIALRISQKKSDLWKFQNKDSNFSKHCLGILILLLYKLYDTALDILKYCYGNFKTLSKVS